MRDEASQPPSVIRAALQAHDHRPNRAFGQNFLADPNIVRKIVDAASLDQTSRVVEVGAGTGALTVSLGDVAGRVIAYEIDRGLEPILADHVGGRSNVEVRMADATTADWNRELGGGAWTMVANLPYNVGTGILLDALQHAPSIERFVVMVQSEVADRLLAGPGSRTYGLPSVIVALHATGHRAFSVPPQVFEPQPPVDSAVIVLDRVDPPAEAPAAIEIAAAAFGQRRKMLRRSLAAMLDDPVNVLEAAAIDPTLRAEQLAPDDYVAIAQGVRR